MNFVSRIGHGRKLALLLVLSVLAMGAIGAVGASTLHGRMLDERVDKPACGRSSSKPGQTEPLRKLSAVARFAPWDIAIYSGTYVDDLDAATTVAAAAEQASTGLGTVATATEELAASHRQPDQPAGTERHHRGGAGG